MEIKIPFRYQVSEYDCVPTALINAITYLFDRRAIPPLVIRFIYIYSLDAVARGGRIGRSGTSKYAIRLLGHWLESYKTEKFSVATEYLEGEEVHLCQDNKILSCLNEGGVALCKILLSGAEEHFIVGLNTEGEWIHFFDPYWRQAIRGLRGKARLLDSECDCGPNLAIRCDWLDTDSDRHRFCLGAKPNRECLLMWKMR